MMTQKFVEEQLDREYRAIVLNWQKAYDKAAADTTLEPKGFYVDKHELSDVALGLCRSGVDSEVVYKAHEVIMRKIKQDFANSLNWDLEVEERIVLGLDDPILEYYLHRRYEQFEVVPKGESIELIPIYGL